MQYVVGADEVGTGCIAGPLVVCAVCVPADWRAPLGLNDSKKMTPDMRERVGRYLRRDPYVHRYVVMRDNEEIDFVGVRPTLLAAIRQALHIKDHYPYSERRVIVDGDMNIAGAESIVKADGTVPAVMAASVLAKVWRDQYMRLMDTEYPGYGFAEHKGYGTTQHREALAKLGPCKIHRRSFEPVKSMVNHEHEIQPAQLGRGPEAPRHDGARPGHVRHGDEAHPSHVPARRTDVPFSLRAVGHRR